MEKEKFYDKKNKSIKFEDEYFNGKIWKRYYEFQSIAILKLNVSLSPF